MVTKKSVLALAMAMLASTGMAAAASVPAHAAVAQPTISDTSDPPVQLLGIYDDECDGESELHVATAYSTGDGHNYFLRCGHTGPNAYGYRWIDSRRFDGFDAFLESAVTNILANGTRDPQGDNVFWYNWFGSIVEVDEDSAPDSFHYGVTDVFLGSPEKGTT